MLTVNSINNHNRNCQPAFKAGEKGIKIPKELGTEGYADLRSKFKAMGDEITSVERQEIIQIKEAGQALLEADLSLKNIIALFFRFVFGHKTHKTQKTKHPFKNDYGKFNLTDNGLKQYLSTISELSTAHGEIKRLEGYCSNYQETKELSNNRAIAAICEAKLELLKSMGEINTTDIFDLHSFKNKRGKFLLSNKGLEQYLAIVSKLEKANAEIRRLECHCSNIQDNKDLSNNRAIAERCEHKLSLLQNIKELPENV